MNTGKSSVSNNIYPPRRKKSTRKKVMDAIRIFFLVLSLVIIGAGIYAGTILYQILSDAPDISYVAVAPTEAATYIYNQEGKRTLKLTLPEANRDLVTIDRIPLDMQHAVVAIEDERFYEHHGIDPKGILRAFFTGIRSGSFTEGASTITQQLLKNSVFPNWTKESTFKERLTRKIQEQYLALQLEKKMSKEQILEDYLNTINLGAGCYGVQAAAYRYFGKDVSELTLSECTVIAGISQNPTSYNPIVYPEKNAGRRRDVLEHMLEQGYISQAQYQDAMTDDVYSRIHSNEENSNSMTSIYTFYQDAMIDQILEDLMEEKGYTYKQAVKAVYTGGLRIYSAQDDQIQQICDEEFSNSANFPAGTEVGIDYALSIENPDGEITNYGSDDLRRFVRSTSDPAFDLMYSTSEEAHASAESFKASVLGEHDAVLGERVTITPQPQASVVIIDQSTGYVKAIVGGRGDKEASLTLNRATYTQRQPGSTFKILTAYAPALDIGGKTLISTYDNEAYAYEDGTPVSNWDLNNYTGPTTIRDAITRSINVVAVKCITEITPRVGFEYAKAMGITSLKESYDNGTEILSDIVQPLALGGITTGVTGLELCGAYATIANLGKYIKPRFYTQVLDQYGNVVLDNSTPATHAAMKASTATLLTSAMRDVISDPEGTAYGLINLGYMPTAGKTGTTSSYKDIWFAGFTPYYTCCVWGGYDNNANLPADGIYHTYNKVLWNSIMNRIHQNLPITAFPSAGDVISVNICKSSNLVAVPGVCDSYEEKFLAGTQPDHYCSIHGSGAPVDPGSNTAGGSDLAPGAITIYSTDQTVIYPDILDELGAGLQDAAGNTAEDTQNNAQGNTQNDAMGNVQNITQENMQSDAQGNTQVIIDGPVWSEDGNGRNQDAENNRNDMISDVGTQNGWNDNGVSGEDNSGQNHFHSSGDLWEEQGMDDSLTQEQILILNQIPEALP